MKQALATAVACAFSPAVIAAGGLGDLEVIYSEVPGHHTAEVPGTRNLTGGLIYSEWLSMVELWMSPDGTQWAVRGQNNLPTTELDTVLVLGSGATGTTFLQDGQTVAGGFPGQVYDFFGTVTWDESNRLAYEARPRGTNDDHMLVKFDGNDHDVVLREGDPTVGAVNCTTFGNSMGSIHLLNDGRIGFVNTPVACTSSVFYPIFFYSHTAFVQCNVDSVKSEFGDEIWDGLLLEGSGGTPDGQHHFITGDTANPITTADFILAIDGQSVMRESKIIPGTSIVLGPDGVFRVNMLANGDWYARGDDVNDRDWAIRNGQLIAKSGDPITAIESRGTRGTRGGPPRGGADEDWGLAFGNFTGNIHGDWVLAGNTTHPDEDLDYVVVLNGLEVIIRESDPVDLDGDGLFNDDTFIRTIHPNDMYLTNGGMLYCLVTLKNGAGTNLGDAFVRMQVIDECPGDINGDQSVNVTDLLALIAAWGPCADPGNCPADLNGDEIVNVTDLLALIAAWGPCS